MSRVKVQDEKYIKIIDNFLPLRFFNELEDVINTEWELNFVFTENDVVPKNHITYKLKNDLGLKEEVLDTKFIQFIHEIYDRTGMVTKRKDIFVPLMEYFFDKLGIELLITSKLNITFPANEHYLAGFHVDFKYDNSPNYKTAMFYFSNTDGDTVLEDGTKIKCVKNRLAIIDGSTHHCGITCTDENRRTVLNFNYIGKDL
jgi:hypothetical protein